MFCHVCSKEINYPKYETIGKQVVCCLSCVGLLISNEEDKCDQCQRPVWKDNYYIFHSKNYCSEKCKITAVKRYLKQNSSLTGVNIKHIQNEYFKNDSPIKNLQELRKEVKELYNDFEFEENCSSKNIPELSENKTIKTIYSDKSKKKTEEINESFSNNKNKIEPEYPNNINNNLIDESDNNINLIQNKIHSIKMRNNDNNIINYNESYKCPRLLSKKKILKSYRRERNNYSFDNKDRMLYDNNNDMDNIKNIKMKYSFYKSNHSISNINKSFKKNMKLKPTIFRHQNRDKKMRNKLIIRIPNPHMSNVNEKNNFKYKDPFINNENENYENIDYRNRNNFDKKYKQFNTAYENSQSPNFTNINKDNETTERRLVYLCEPKYKLIKNCNF